MHSAERPSVHVLVLKCPVSRVECNIPLHLKSRCDTLRPEGIEPPAFDLESNMLPLHHGPDCSFYVSSQRYTPTPNIYT